MGVWGVGYVSAVISAIVIVGGVGVSLWWGERVFVCEVGTCAVLVGSVRGEVGCAWRVGNCQREVLVGSDFVEEVKQEDKDRGGGKTEAAWQACRLVGVDDFWDDVEFLLEVGVGEGVGGAARPRVVFED